MPPGGFLRGLQAGMGNNDDRELLIYDLHHYYARQIISKQPYDKGVIWKRII